MSIRFTPTSNKCVNRVLIEKISVVASAYCESGTLHIGYALHLNDLRESSYIPDDSSLPTLVVCSKGNSVVDIKGNNAKIKNEVITALRDRFISRI